MIFKKLTFSASYIATLLYCTDSHVNRSGNNSLHLFQLSAPVCYYTFIRLVVPLLDVCILFSILICQGFKERILYFGTYLDTLPSYYNTYNNRAVFVFFEGKMKIKLYFDTYKTYYIYICAVNQSIKKGLLFIAVLQFLRSL